MKQIRVLSLGIGQSNFLTQLYDSIKKLNPDYLFSIDGYSDISKGEIDYQKNVFENYYNFSESKITFYQSLIAFFRILFNPYFWRVLTFELKQNPSYRHCKKIFLKELFLNAVVYEVIKPLSFSIYHFHFCVAKNMEYIRYLPKKASVVCSFWGSDLYRNLKKKNHFYVAIGLKRANCITIQTQEMTKDLLEKYPFLSLNKIINAQFTLEEKVFQYIDQFKKEPLRVQKFKEKYQIPNSKLILVIGYNANEAFNHIKILNVLSKMDTSSLHKLAILLPLPYGRNKEYLAKLKTVINNFPPECIVINEFLDFEEIALLRIVSDVQIQMPTSDALSGSVTEVLYAGNIVLAASWLPYGIYERLGVQMKFLDTFEAINNEISLILENTKHQKALNSVNPKLIEDHFFPKKTAPKWLEIYEKALA